MPIAIRCSSCQAAFRVRDEYAGKRGKCPKCGAIFLAAAQASPAESPPASPPREPELPDPAPRIRSSAAKPKSPGVGGASAPGSPPARVPSAASAPPATAASTSAGNAWPDFTSSDATSPAVAADDRLARVAARGRKKPRPQWVWFAMAGALLAGVSALFGYQMWSGGSQQTAQRRLDPEARRIAQGNAPRTAGFVPKPAEKLDLKKPGPGASTEDIIAYVEHGIVKIDVYDEYNNRHGLGSGFVIDDSGLIATNYHVIDDAVKAEVQFNDGIRYGVEGYVALRPESDLAVLKLNGTPPNMR
ncbi:MAG: trypsin-like peptidase domain-containing protein, partial [Planctomycetaceae bacterium]|nr:trypsin-like peptidase domain-containing protein [Planctomycetaceae bacterium]